MEIIVTLYIYGEQTRAAEAWTKDGSVQFQFLYYYKHTYDTHEEDVEEDEDFDNQNLKTTTKKTEIFHFFSAFFYLFTYLWFTCGVI